MLFTDVRNYSDYELVDEIQKIVDEIPELQYMYRGEVNRVSELIEECKRRAQNRSESNRAETKVTESD